jgi:hypothetical protein
LRPSVFETDASANSATQARWAPVVYNLHSFEDTFCAVLVPSGGLGHAI